MIYNESELQLQARTAGLLSLLESLPPIGREWVDTQPSELPLLEFEDFSLRGVHFVRYSDLAKLSEAKEISIQEAAEEVRNINLLPKDKFVVAMEEWLPLAYPGIENSFDNVVLMKESQESLPYQLCEACLNPYLESKDKFFLDCYLESIENPYFAQALLQEFQLADGTYISAADMAKMTPEQRAEIKAQIMDKATDASKGNFSNFNSKNPDAAKASRDAYQAQQARKQARRNALMKTNAPLATPQAPVAQSGGEQQGWWARNWAAFKNWMNGLGSNGDQKSQWFTNMIDKIKSKFNGNVQQAQASAPPTKAPTDPKQAAANAASEKMGGFIDNMADKLGNATGMDMSGLAAVAKDKANNFVNTAVNDPSKALNQAKELGKQAMNKGKELVQKGKEMVNNTSSSSTPTTPTKTA